MSLFPSSPSCIVASVGEDLGSGRGMDTEAAVEAVVLARPRGWAKPATF